MPNRHGVFDPTNSYRYGFNGMEKDDEIKGDDNSYDFGARMLDPRVGRWFAPDKMGDKYPSLSGYNSFANNPLFFVDPDGNEIEPWKWFRVFFMFKFGPFYSLTSHYDSDVKFDKTYQKMYKSSKIFKTIINQLKNSSRTYRFTSTYNSSRSADGPSEGGHFDPNHTGTKSDPYTINFMVDYKNETTTADDTGVIFEETFHAAQSENAILNNKTVSDLATEVEAKLVKNIEGLNSKNPDYNYEVMNFEGSEEIFEALRSRKPLTEKQRTVLGREIMKLAENVSRVYNDITNRYPIESFNLETDLNFAEKLYGQNLTNKSSTLTEVVVKAKAKPKKK